MRPRGWERPTRGRLPHVSPPGSLVTLPFQIKLYKGQKMISRAFSLEAKAEETLQLSPKRRALTIRISWRELAEKQYFGCLCCDFFLSFIPVTLRCCNPLRAKPVWALDCARSTLQLPVTSLTSERALRFLLFHCCDSTLMTVRFKRHTCLL